MSSKTIMPSTIAILLFAQSENVESTRKPISDCSKKNILLWKKMNNRVLKTIQKTKQPFFISNETNQVGNTFGEKLTKSVQDIFNKGFEKVIVIGNDCISLNSNHLRSAAKNLKTKSCVLGADKNGGVYLIGISKSAFNAEQFANIPWQTKQVFSALQTINSLNSIAYIDCLQDCNSSIDFRKALLQLPYFSIFRKIFQSFLFVLKTHFLIEVPLKNKQQPLLLFNKGSPFLQNTSFY